jgi:dienelactone hydrolase
MIKRLLPVIFLLASALAAGPGALYESQSGPYAVERDDTVTLDVIGEERTLPLRVIYPSAGGSCPVIVFSHGTFSSGQRYDLVADYWAVRGYVVILPDHVDANYGIVPKKNEDMFRVGRQRVADMTLIVDSLDEIERRIPKLAGRMDRQKLIAAGHSFGTQIAMLVTGLRMRNPTNGEVTEAGETRFELLVMLSDPGKMTLMPAETWKGSSVPTFLSTGTEDYGLMGDGRRAAEYQNEILSGDSEARVARYLLLIDRGDHYFGGLIHKDTDGEPDREGLEIFNATSTAFLDAYAKNDEAARSYLQTVELLSATGGRATLQTSSQRDD